MGKAFSGYIQGNVMDKEREKQNWAKLGEETMDVSIVGRVLAMNFKVCYDVV